MNLPPIIRLEVDRMKHGILAALSEHAVSMDAMVRAAVDDYCSSDNLYRVIADAARDCINEAVREETQNFFRATAKGRAAVREAVLVALDREFPDITKLPGRPEVQP